MRILVTTDGSERSFRVYPHAASLAKAAGAEVVVLQVLDPRVDAATELDLNLQRAAQRVAVQWQEELAEFIEHRHLDAMPRVAVKGQREDTEDTILRVAEEEGAALIAMDTRGTSALRHLIAGSVATGVVGKGRLPVMLTGDHAREPKTHGQYRLLLTNDGSEAAVDVVKALGPVLRAASPEVTVLRVYDPRLGDRGTDAEVAAAHAELEALVPSIPGGDVRVHVAMPNGVEKVGSTILRVAEEIGADAIAMSTHGHSARRHLFAGSVTMGCLGNSPVPVIVAR
ncbi:MAG TPA: universal stress protein [Tepidiformaceae bacterium]|nr:universal stress protein [Tepidiformaceae bacterium]